METLDFSKASMCRLCESTTNLYYLFDADNKHVIKKLRSCVDIRIENNDLLPKLICLECDSNLESAYKFKIQCEFIDEKFRRLIRNCKKQISLNDHVEDKTYICDEQLENKYTVELIEDDCVLFTEEFDENSLRSDEMYIVEEAVEENLVKTSEENETPEEHAYVKEYQDEESNVTLDEFDQNIEEILNLEQYNDSSNQHINVEFKTEPPVEIIEYELENKDAIKLDSDDLIEVLENDSNIEEIHEENELTCDSSESFKKSYPCETCNEEFTIYAHLKTHRKSHGKHRFQCTECSKWFPKRNLLKNHQLLHSGEKQFTCKQCSKSYTNPGNLERHIRVFHLNERRYSCNICNKTFSQTTILRQHYAVHKQERDFECDICHKRYKTKEYLNLHKDRHLPVSQRRTKPYVPNKNRIQKPTPIKIYICSYCGKKSNNIALHQSHLRTHTGEKPYECSTCKKKFSFQQSLKTHMFLHTGEKPFACSTCGITFRQIGHLKGHQLVHTGEKKHECLVCGKSFALRGNLTVHMRLHTGETPFHCNYCPKKFYDSNGLKRHKLVHTKNNALKLGNEEIENDLYTKISKSHDLNSSSHYNPNNYAILTIATMSSDND